MMTKIFCNNAIYAIFHKEDLHNNFAYIAYAYDFKTSMTIFPTLDILPKIITSSKIIDIRRGKNNKC